MLMVMAGIAKPVTAFDESRPAVSAPLAVMGGEIIADQPRAVELIPCFSACPKPQHASKPRRPFMTYPRGASRLAKFLAAVRRNESLNLQCVIWCLKRDTSRSGLV
jgi:hypothetical protein